MINMPKPPKEIDISPDQVKLLKFEDAVTFKTEFGNKAFSRNWGITPDGDASFKEIANRMTKIRVYQHEDDGQTLGAGAWTKIVLKTEEYDTIGEFDSTTNYRFTAKSAGYYLIIGSIWFGGLADGNLFITSIYKNGVATSTQRGVAAAASIESKQVTDIFKLNTNDYIELYGWHTSGGDIDFGSDHVFLAINKLSN